MQIIGGYARRNSVTFLSENYIATASRTGNGLITVSMRNRYLASARNPLFRLLTRVPFVRGIVALLTVLLQSKPIALLLGASIVVSLLPETTSNSLANQALVYLDFVLGAGALVLVGLNFYRFRDVKKYHGAEHKAANAFAQTHEISVEAASQGSRVHERCGTNFLAIIAMVATIVQLVTNWDVDYSVLIGFGVAGEVVKLRNTSVKKPFLWVGGQMQKYLTTAEPSEREIEVAVAALKALSEAEI